MPFDPAADPWGAAMLGTGGVGALALLGVLVSWARGRRPTFAGWCLGIGTLAFLGSAAAGTAERIRARDEDGFIETAAEDPAAKRQASADDAAAAPSDDSEATSLRDGERPDTTASDASDPTPPARPAPAPLPTDPRARRAAAFAILKEAKQVSRDQRCTNPAALASAAAEVAALPPDVFRSRARVVMKHLETCRRKVAWILENKRKREQIEARERYADALRETEGSNGKSLVVRLTGMQHENIRIVDLSLRAEALDDALTPALLDELAGLGFTRAVYSNGKASRARTLEPASVHADVDRELAALGLAEPLRLD